MGHYDDHTGRDLECEVLGTVEIEWHGYMSFRESTELVKRDQSKCSKRLWMLAELISRRLGAEVKAYTSVGTPLDVFHGVDAFFEFRGTMVSIDLTLNPTKVCHKADVVFNPNLSPWQTLIEAVTHQFELKLAR